MMLGSDSSSGSEARLKTFYKLEWVQKEVVPLNKCEELSVYLRCHLIRFCNSWEHEELKFILIFTSIHVW